MYFLNYLHRYGEYPDDMLDYNLAMDRNCIAYIAQLKQGDALIHKVLDEHQVLSVAQLHDRFNLEEMLKPEHDESFLASLLYYLGVLTLDGVVGLGDLKLKIPNLVIRRLYIEKMRELLLPTVSYNDYKTAVETFYTQGNLQPLCTFIEARLQRLSNRDYLQKSHEFAIKTAFLMFLFNERFYIIDSEPELDRRYADISLMVRPDKRTYPLLDHLLEFKFIKLQELSLTTEQIQSSTLETLQQLPCVKEKIHEAQQQLNYYAQVIQQRYGNSVNLHTHAVIALGFERVLWVTTS